MTGGDVGKARYFELAAFPLPGESVYQALVTKYILILTYAIGTVIFGLPAVSATAGYLWGVILPGVLTLAATLALLGTVRSRHTGRVRLEYWATLILLAGFVSYAIAIAWRSLSEPGRIDSLPSTLLPVLLMVFPYFRLRQMLKPGGGVRPVTGEVPIVRH